IESLPVMHGGISPKDMLDNMGLACAMGMPLDRVFTGSERERHTILDAPRWAIDGRDRLAFNTTHGVSRAVLYPTYMLAGGTLLPPPRHHGGLVPRLPDGHDVHALRHDGGRGLRPLPDHADDDPRGRRRLAAVLLRAPRRAPEGVRPHQGAGVEDAADGDLRPPDDGHGRGVRGDRPQDRARVPSRRPHRPGVRL